MRSHLFKRSPSEVIQEQTNSAHPASELFLTFPWNGLENIGKPLYETHCFRPLYAVLAKTDMTRIICPNFVWIKVVYLNAYPEQQPSACRRGVMRATSPQP